MTKKELLTGLGFILFLLISVFLSAPQASSMPTKPASAEESSVNFAVNYIANRMTASQVRTTVIPPNNSSPLSISLLPGPESLIELTVRGTLPNQIAINEVQFIVPGDVTLNHPESPCKYTSTLPPIMYKPHKDWKFDDGGNSRFLINGPTSRPVEYVTYGDQKLAVYYCTISTASELPGVEAGVTTPSIEQMVPWYVTFEFRSRSTVSEAGDIRGIHFNLSWIPHNSLSPRSSDEYLNHILPSKESPIDFAISETNSKRIIGIAQQSDMSIITKSRLPLDEAGPVQIQWSTEGIDPVLKGFLASLFALFSGILLNSLIILRRARGTKYMQGSTHRK